MFTYIELKNFMSFNNVKFDFRKSKQPKKFIAVYGENGSGKTQFVKSIELLKNSIDTLTDLKKFDKIYNEMSKKEDKKEDFSELFSLLKNELCNPNIFSKCMMMDNDEPTIIEYGFEFNNHKGYYIIKFKDRLMYEKLYYFTGKQSGTIFEIDYKNNVIESNFARALFSNSKIKKEIEMEIEKYWGKHTFLAILSKERLEKNETFIENNYLKNVFDIHDMLHNISISKKEKDGNIDRGSTWLPNIIIKDIGQGRISIEQKELLEKTKDLLNIFFTQTYADIKKVFYRIKKEDSQISYELFFNKMIAGKIRTIPFSKESAGTQNLARIIQVLLGAFCGTIVVYDEIDNGIHDLLLSKVIASMKEYITGQVIITTHNTNLLEEVDKNDVYLINVDYEGNKEVICLNDYKIQKTNNIRTMYLNGLFGGIPFVDDIDYDEMQEIINDIDEHCMESYNGIIL